MKKVILITGTNSGFGWLAANSVAALGHTVYATMRDTKGKNAEKAQKLSMIENINVIDVELTNAASVAGAVKNIIAKESRLDVVVNNAGITKDNLLMRMTEEHFNDVIIEPALLLSKVSNNRASR